jgi:prephenate dehydrogenase
MSSSFHRVTIVGLGLIGGSWALALKKCGFAGEVVGCDRSEVLDHVQALGAIDAGDEHPASAACEADLVILSTPVGAILDLLPVLRRTLLPRALVTDVGSTKRLICQRAREILDLEPLFLGGHPLAGKERSGFASASAELFQNARYALTPLSPDHLRDPRVQAFSDLVTSIGARPFVTDASAHDRAIAFLSHLPQLVSTGLSSLVAEQGGEEFLPLELAATGFRDMTRLADSPYALWRDICLTNVENIQSALESLVEKLEAMKLHLSDRELEREFKQAHRLRDRLRDLQ